MLQVLVKISLENFNCRRRGMGYANVIQKSIKNGQVSEILKTMGT
jgi:hypothetical protein